MESNNETTEGLLVFDEKEVTDTDNYIDTDDLPSTTTASSDKKHLFWCASRMNGQDTYQPRIINPYRDDSTPGG